MQPAVQSETSAAIRSLQARLEQRFRELCNAETTIHTLRLEQLARERQISELKAQLFAAATSGNASDKPATSTTAPEQPSELYDEIVAAADQERATHLEYIEYLKARLAELEGHAGS